MTEKRRYSPVTILYELVKMVKSWSFIILLLFVLNANSTSNLMVFGRKALLVIIGYSVIAIIVRWFTNRYKLDHEAFHLYKGVFNKSEQTVPIANIHTINKQTTFTHRLLKMTSIYFETGIAGDDGIVKFEMISIKEAKRMEEHVQGVKSEKAPIAEEVENRIGVDSVKESMTDENLVQQSSERKIHFQPTMKDTIKAAFTSLSFLLLISIFASLYAKISQLFKVEDVAEGFLQKVVGSWLFTTLIVVVILIGSVLFGLIKTYLQYGKYEVASDSKTIFIKKGVLSETSFSIAKDKVQAIEIEQSFMKRMLGLAEVKLTTVGNLNISGEGPEVNSLYPFLPRKIAYEMISELLPSYTVTKEMERLPKPSFLIRMFRPSWFWIVITIALVYFQPKIIDNEHLWVSIPIILFLLIVISRLLDYYNTRYVMNEQFIQIKKGGFSSSLFVSKREKVIEIEVTQTILQKKFNLASIAITNREKPIRYTDIKDLPSTDAVQFMNWYKDRKYETMIEER